MAINIPSINIRRLYTDEELKIANTIRMYETAIKDIMTLEKIKELKKIEDSKKSDEKKSKNKALGLVNLTWVELQRHYLSSKWDDENILYRDNKKVKMVESFTKKNYKKIHKDILLLFSRENEELKEFRKEIREYSKKLNNILKNNVKKRELSHIYKLDYVSLSESALTSALEIKEYTETDRIIIITVNQEDMMRDILNNGFIHEGKDYKLYSASAGQLRKKKIMFIEEEYLNKAMNKLTCGLSIEKINIIGGVNINKWSAYLALSTSATKIWKEVNLNRICIVDDFETILKNREVDHINDNYELNRVRKDVSIPHTDGFGMMNPKFCKDTRMIRAPWIKGLVAPMDYNSFVKTFNGKNIICDIWGKEHSVENLDIILTKSQFKMWKYYNSWQEYIDKFEKYGCEFRYMISESKKDLRKNALFNYQMWQTLKIDNKKEFADNILEGEKELIRKAHSEVGAMLEMFNVDKDYDRNNNLQKALYLYPSILKNEGFKTSLKDNIKSKKKDLRQGRIKINGVYTFILPDVFAWCERLFLDIEVPIGLLKDGEVSCKLATKSKEILVNRSPHLYPNEHCVRKNARERCHSRWFIGNGVYTSTHDMISKRLFFDVDGDISLIVENDELVEIAKETTRGLVPLDFRLEKAPSQIITNENIYSSYQLAFKANIGEASNRITKVANSKITNKDIELIAKICWINNQQIDRAKTNWILPPTEELKKELKGIDSTKLPYFFIWAKDKEFDSVEPPNENSLVDQMALSIDNLEDRIKFSFRKIEKLDITKLLKNKELDKFEFEDLMENEIYFNLIENLKYLANSKVQTMIKRSIDGDSEYKTKYINEHIKRSMFKFCEENGLDLDIAVDICVLHMLKNNRERDAVFTIFGNQIVERLELEFSQLIDNTYIRCKICGTIIVKTNNKTIYCENCSESVKKEQDKKAMEKYTKNKKK